LGRSLIDLLDTLKHLEHCGVDVFIDQQNIDTTSPMGKLMFQIVGAFSEFERGIIVERVKAGLNRARKAGKKFGRPKIDLQTETAIRAALKRGGKGILKIAAEQGVGSGTVQRIRREMA
jgi:DNA invertase Pin-like site-specific DNA recombinase